MMNRITRFSLVAILTSAAAIAQQPVPQMTCDDRNSDGDRAHYCEINESTLAAAATLNVDGGTNGGVQVKGWQKNEILVRAKVETSAETDADARALARQITIRTGGGTIMADGPASGHHQNWSVSYEVFVPRNIDLDLKAHNGGVAISDVRGQIEFSTINGGVSLHRLAGRVHGRTTNGGLSVELAGNRWDGDELDASTTNGGISMSMPDGYSAHLETGTVNGNIHIDFPVTVQGEIRRNLSTDIGAGGPMIRLTTTNGGVSIRRKEA